MPDLDCESLDRKDTVQRYLTQRLGEAEQEAFETHFLACAHCQRELELGIAVRALLPATSPERTARWRIWAGIGGLAAAAALGALLLLPSQRGSEPWRALGAVRQAPLYLGVPIRGGAPNQADSLFATGMSQYMQEHFDRSAAELEQALRAGANAVPTEFFLAASRLMTGHAREAAAGFARTVAMGDTPYRSEAHFYQAKALLQLGRPADAARELTEAARSGGVIGAYARALADSLQEIGRR